MIIKPTINIIFRIAKVNSTSPYTLIKNILVLIMRMPMIVIQTPFETDVVQNDINTAAAVISAGILQIGERVRKFESKVRVK